MGHWAGRGEFGGSFGLSGLKTSDLNVSHRSITCRGPLRSTAKVCGFSKPWAWQIRCCHALM